MNVRELMSEELFCVTPETAIDDAARLMRDKSVGALPVCAEGRLVGIVTDRDLVIRHLAEEARPGTVRRVMTPDPVTIGVDDPLERAEALMAQHRVRRLPVLDAGRLVGVLCQADIARGATHEQVGTLVEAISQGGESEPISRARTAR